MLQVVSTGAYYPLVDTTWKILTTGASYLTAGALCTGATLYAGLRLNWNSCHSQSPPAKDEACLLGRMNWKYRTKSNLFPCLMSIMVF